MNCKITHPVPPQEDEINARIDAAIDELVQLSGADPKQINYLNAVNARLSAQAARLDKLVLALGALKADKFNAGAGVMNADRNALKYL